MAKDILTLGPVSEICKFLPAFEAHTLFVRLHPRTNRLIKQFPNICIHASSDDESLSYDCLLYELLVTRKYDIPHASLTLAIGIVCQENEQKHPNIRDLQSKFVNKYSKQAIIDYIYKGAEYRDVCTPEITFSQVMTYSQQRTAFWFIYIEPSVIVYEHF